MAYNIRKHCLYCSVLLVFMLIYQVSSAQYNFDKVSSWLRENLGELGARAVLMIYKDGKVIYTQQENDLTRAQEAMGKIVARRIGKNQEDVLKDYDINSKISIASCSKWLSAALVMTFIDEGKLTLTDTIGKFLPVMTENGKGKITIRDCLAHLTGIKSGNLKESRELASNSKTMDDAMIMIASQPMEAAPGKAFHYSSIGLQIAAAVIEKISGKNFETLFHERIAIPCNMLNTDFGYKPVPIPAGGARSTATDYLNFLKMILRNGEFNGNKVLSKDAVVSMQQNYALGKKIIYSPAEAGSWGYGLGEWVMNDVIGGTSSKAVSSPGLFGSFPWVDNEHQYAAVLFTFNIKSKGRHQKYTLLKQLIDTAITNN